jgi:hypothetical protein
MAPTVVAQLIAPLFVAAPATVRQADGIRHWQWGQLLRVRLGSVRRGGGAPCASGRFDPEAIINETDRALRVGIEDPEGVKMMVHP